MSIINNDNFDRDTKLDPAPLNTKFTDVTTGTTSIDETNVRNSGIDNPQFVQNLTNGRNGFLLYLIEQVNWGSVGGTAIAHSVFAVPTVLPNAMNMNGGAAITLVEGDIIRAYWFTGCTKNWASVSSVQSRSAWVQWLQWNLGATGWTEVPGQGDFTTAVFGAYVGEPVTNVKASTFIHHTSIIESGAAVENVAPTDAVSIANYYIASDIGGVTPGQLTASGAWVHTVTAAEAGTKTLSFRFVAAGLVAPIYDNVSNANYLVQALTQPNTPTLQIYGSELVVIIMRGK